MCFLTPVISSRQKVSKSAGSNLTVCEIVHKLVLRGCLQMWWDIIRLNFRQAFLSKRFFSTAVTTWLLSCWNNRSRYFSKSLKFCLFNIALSNDSLKTAKLCSGIHLCVILQQQGC